MTPDDPATPVQVESDAPIANPAIEEVAFRRATPAPSVRRPPITLPQMALLGVLLLLAAAAFLVFTATAVRFVVDPAPDELGIRGGVPAFAMGDRYLMRPGSYQLVLRKAGYQEATHDILVTDAAEQTFEFQLAKLPGRLTITSKPATDATVLLDGAPVGKPPLELASVVPGEHSIRIESKRFKPFETRVSIQGMGVQQQLLAELEPAWAMIGISSTPPGAGIRSGDDQLAVTPAGVELIEGERPLSLHLPGYKTWQTLVRVQAGVDQQLPAVTLVKADGTLHISSTPAKASITIDGQYRGTTPAQIRLTPGRRYQVVVSKAGYESQTRAVDVEAEVDQEIDLALTAVTGDIELVVDPADSELYVDGKRQGDPNRILTLIASEHELELRKAGFVSWKQRLTPKPGFPQRIKVRLQPGGQAAQAGAPAVLTAPGGMKLVLVEPGRFTMGSPRREPGRRSNEIERNVQLTRAFYLATTEVSNEQFKAFASGHDSGMISRILLNQPERPAVNLSWEEAVGYCNWLSDQQKLPRAYVRSGSAWQLVQPVNGGYRLPTEAEWEYAARFARQSKVSRFPWGNDMPPPPGSGNYADESARNLVSYSIEGYNDSFRGTAPAAKYPPNALGIHDLAGNVAEWTHDFYSTSPVAAAKVLIDPVGPDIGTAHVIRGSSYLHGRFSELRWTYRDFGTEGRADVGFRVARSATSTAEAAKEVADAPAQ